MTTYKTALEEFRAEMVAELGHQAAKQLKFGKHLPAVPSRDEVWALYGMAKTTRDLLIVRTFYASAVRNAELVDLLVADVLPDTFELFVRGGKGGIDRLVLVDEGTMAMLVEWRDSERLKPAQRVFGLHTTRQMHRIVHGCGVRTGIVAKYQAMGRSFSPHALRHSAATHAYENGMDLFTLQKLLGHHFLETTRIYVHLGMAQETQVYQKTHELCRRPAPTVATWVDPKAKKKK